MIRISTPPLSLAATLALASFATAQQVLITTDDSTDTIVAFSPIDGSVINPALFSIPNTVQVCALQVGSEIWCDEQGGDRIVRYDVCGNELGVIGPSFPGGGLDNIRGMSLINGIVYVTNDGNGNGATPDSLVTFDAAGNHLGTLALSSSPSPFSVQPYQGDLLVFSSGGPDKVHRYTTAGASVSTLVSTDATFGFTHASFIASDGNIWVSTFTTDTIVKMDPATGFVLQTIPADNARGIYELANGNLLWTTANGGAFVYDFGTMTNTQVLDGSMYNLQLANLDFACHKPYGQGCHDYTQDTNLFQLFPDVASADAALEGHSMYFALTVDGYSATWLPNTAAALYVPPTGAAVVVANGSAAATTFTPSAPIPIPGGTTPNWTISSEGILTAGGPGNQGTSSTASLASTATAAGLAWYTWINQNPTETGSGKVKTEEAAGVLYVTFDGVELATGTPTASPSTYQWQINMTTGDVTMVWLSMFGVGNNSTSDVLVGCTLAGTSAAPVSQDLTKAIGHVLSPVILTQVPLTLSAAPSPVINPSTNVTFSITNVPETSPGSGLYLSLVFFSLSPFPTGFDLLGLVTTRPGCNLYLASLDVSFGLAVTAVPVNNVPLTFSTPTFAPGDVIGAQAVALFDPAFPLLNGESGGFLLSNGVRSQSWPQ
jgi:hypothetical protein